MFSKKRMVDWISWLRVRQTAERDLGDSHHSKCYQGAAKSSLGASLEYNKDVCRIAAFHEAPRSQQVDFRTCTSGRWGETCQALSVMLINCLRRALRPSFAMAQVKRLLLDFHRC